MAQRRAGTTAVLLLLALSPSGAFLAHSAGRHGLHGTRASVGFEELDDVYASWEEPFEPPPESSEAGVRTQFDLVRRSKKINTFIRRFGTDWESAVETLNKV